MSDADDPWVQLGTQIHRSTRRRLGVYLAMNDDPNIRDVVDEALDEFLERQQWPYGT